MMRINSLAFRLFASAAAWTLLVLPIAAFVLVSLYRDAVERSFDARLNLYLTTLIAGTASDENGHLESPASLGEPLFSLPFSGWYWQIKAIGSKNKPEFISESLLDQVLIPPSEQGVEPDENLVRQTYVDGPEGQRLRIVEREITFGEGRNARKYSIAVAGDSVEIEQEISGFTAMLIVALATLGIGLVAATLFQVQFGLRPLRAIGEGLAAIRSGEETILKGDLPAEIEPLQRELNALIKSNRDVLERARTHVGNLAHALKTPLSVISNEARGKRSLLAKKVDEQTEIMRSQITHYLDRARVAARTGVVSSVSEVFPVVDSLKRTLERIYDERQLTIKVSCPQDIKFQGERHDLEEMVGNLFDNACKWAESEVSLNAYLHSDGNEDTDSYLIIAIDDDGPGLPENQRIKAVKRGLKLDESKPGSGLGLAIVADLASLYKGELELDQSAKGGLRAKLNLPTVL